jgi:AraC-like DNA-binding protein
MTSGLAALPVGGADPIGEVFRTSDLDEARAVVTAAYGPHRLETGARQPFETRIQSAELGPVNLCVHTYGSDVTLISPPLRQWYVVCLPVTGHVSVRCGGDTGVIGDGLGVLLRPDRVIEFGNWNHDTTLLALRIQRSDLEHELGTTLNRSVHGPIAFKFAVDARRSDGRFLRAVHHLLGELRSADSMTDYAASRGHFSRLVMAALIAGQPNEYSEQLKEGDQSLTPRVIREATELIDHRYAEPLTVGDMATAVTRSVRSIEDSFQRYLGVSPMAYLRQVRLNHARAALRAADPLETSVASVARSCGFTHPPRFAAYYFQQFGVYPSADLRRQDTSARS